MTNLPSCWNIHQMNLAITLREDNRDVIKRRDILIAKNRKKYEPVIVELCCALKHIDPDGWENWWDSEALPEFYYSRAETLSAAVKALTNRIEELGENR